MRVRALTSFAGSGFSVGQGDEFDLPEGVDWLRAGLVEAIVEPPMNTNEHEKAVAEPSEKAVKPRARGRKRA